MTRIITVPFRNEDEDLWTYIEETAGKPVNGTKIRDILHNWMDMNTAVKECRNEIT